MRRISTCGVLVIALCTWSMPTYGTPSPVRVSGKGIAAVVDGNDDGNPDDDVDCTFRVRLSPNSFNLWIDSTQDQNLPLRACPTLQRIFTGQATRGDDSSSNFGDAHVDSSMIGAGELPFFAELVDETGTPGDGAPLSLQDPNDEVRVWGASESFENPRAVGALCNDGGPVARITLGAMSSLLLQLVFRSNDDGTEFLCVPDLPFETAAPLGGGPFVRRDACIPVTADRHLTMAFESDPDNPFLDIDLNRLAPCTARAGAPTATEWGLTALALGLLTVGVWALGRRRTFFNSLRI